MIRILLRTGLDLTFSLTMLTTVVLLILVAMDPRSGEKAAHLWARELSLKTEDACPTVFGNAFWFACAGETRRNSTASATS